MRLRRILAISAMAAVLLAALALLVGHTPMVRARALAWAVALLDRQFGLVLSADAISYNLLTGSASLTNVRLAAKGAESDPFLTASRLAADVPLAAYRGRLLLDDVAIDNGRVAIHVGPDGRSNLPARTGAPPPPDQVRSLALSGLHVNDLAFEYTSAVNGFEVKAAGVHTALTRTIAEGFTGIEGPFAVRGGIDVNWPERRLHVEPIDSRVAFDGSAVAFDALPLTTPMLKAAVSGRITRVFDAQQFELTFNGDAALDEATTWVPLPIPLRGSSRVRGGISGPVGALAVTARFDASSIGAGDESDLSASGEVTVDSAGVHGHHVEASPASGGRAEASFEFPFADEPARVEARWEGVDPRAGLRIARLADQPIGTRLDGRLSLTTGPAQRATIETTATASPDRGLTPIDGRVTANLEAERWSSAYELRTTGLSAAGKQGGRLDPEAWTRSTADGPLRVAISNLASAAGSLQPLGVALPAAVREIGGAIDADVTVSGTLGDPRAAIAAKSDALDVPGLGPAAVTASMTADRRLVYISNLELIRGTSSARGDVSVDLARRTLGGTLSMSSDDLADLLVDVPERWRPTGPVTATAVLEGSLSEPRVNVQAASTPLTVAGQTFDRVDATAIVGSEGIDITTLTLREGDGRIDVSGRYGYDGSYSADLGVEGVSRTASLAGTDTTATLNGTFKGSGTVERPEGSGRFTFSLVGGVAGDLVGDGTADVTLTGAQARVTAQVPALGAFANATVELTAPHEYFGVAVLNHVDLRDASPLLPVTPGQLLGRASLTTAISGDFSDTGVPRVEANLQGLNGTLAELPFWVGSPALITWRPGSLTVRDLAANVGASTITANGEWTEGAKSPFSAIVRGELADLTQAARAFGLETELTAVGPVSLDLSSSGTISTVNATLSLTGARVSTGPELTVSDLNVKASLAGEKFTLDLLTGRLDAAKASGTFAGSGSATIPELDYHKAVGRFAIDRTAIEAGGVMVTQARPSTFSIDHGILTLDDVRFEAAESAIDVAGTVDLTSGGSPGLNLTANGVLVLRILSAFVPALGFDGTADVDLRIGGTTENPGLVGTVRLDDAEVALESPRLVLSELNGPIVLAGDRIELRGISGSANGGVLSVEGGVVLKGTSIGDGEILVQAQGVAVEYPRGLRSEVDALVTYDVSGESPLLHGDVRVQRSAYTEPISLAALARSNTTNTPRPSTGPSALDEMRLNVTVTTVEDIRVDNNYGRFEGGGTLRLVGSVGRPAVTGRFTLREGGAVYALGRTFTINRGTVTFTNLTRIEPEVDIQAETRVSSGGVGDVTLTIQGTPSNLTTDLTSSEGRSREEIANALVGGGVDGGGALTLLSTDILGVTGRQIGLDTLRIDREEVGFDEFREDPSVLAIDEDPTTRLTLSKRLRENVEFTLSQNLRESGKTSFIVSYFPIRNLELRAISRDNSDVGVALRHQITFGGTPVASGRSGAAAGELKITGVSFEGEFAPITEADLRRELRLEAGDRFDFYAWQRDIDRLTELFVKREYLEARVRGRRVDGAAGEISLAYTVRRGPATQLVVEGISLPVSDLRAIREAWTRSVFDRFLVQDAEARVRRYLIAEGYIEPAIKAGTDVAGETKTLRISVVPGQQASRREIRFQGNTALATGRLEAATVQADLEQQAWIDPEALTNALTTLYRDEGFLQAAIKVERPRLENGVGVLPVAIEEGPQTVITEVQFVGVADGREPFMRRALALETPTPYQAARVEEARRRVDRRYRQRGFNAVEVEAALDPDASDAERTLILTVNEGPQQILREVVTSGATRTREGTVEGALRLRVGAPANLEQWSRARKRLYDTNVFRLVDIEPTPIGPVENGVEPVRAVVTVEEYAPWRLRYGFQVDRERVDTEEDGRLDTNLGVTAELRNSNVFGRAIAAGISGRVERDYYNGTLFASNASFFGLPVRSNIYVYRTREKFRFEGVVTAIADTTGVSFEQRWRRWLGVEFTYGYRYERNRTTGLEIGDDRLALIANLGKLTSAVLWDRRSNPLDAQRGTFSAVSWEQGAKWLGSDNLYGKILAQQQTFFTLGPVVTATRAMIGDAFGRDLSQMVPSDRFYAGGATSVRGYAEDSLGPRDIFGLPRGGSQLVVINQELRFPIIRWLRGVGFVDFGNIFDDSYPFAWDQLKTGYGVGLRVSSPVGLLRLDVGIPGSTLAGSSRRANDLGSARWYFGFGHIF